MSSTPNVPTASPLAVAAIATFEMFTEYLNAGFSEDQALRLIAYQLRQQPPS